MSEIQGGSIQAKRIGGFKKRRGTYMNAGLSGSGLMMSNLRNISWIVD